jgi:hypothetical protein
VDGARFVIVERGAISGARTIFPSTEGSHNCLSARGERWCSGGVVRAAWCWLSRSGWALARGAAFELPSASSQRDSPASLTHHELFFEGLARWLRTWGAATSVVVVAVACCWSDGQRGSDVVKRFVEEKCACSRGVGCR